MCGICGIAQGDGKAPVDISALAGMTRALAHRGPDDESVVALPGAGLGVRRLSIIDVEGGRQPICNEDETIWVAQNGEIYNFRELRADLETRGHRFRTRTDTEVLVHLYEEWGDDFVRRLNGMFAIAVWDARRCRLLLARDRCGIKPLYYAAVGDSLAFSSELRSLLAWPRLARRLDPSALAQYLVYEYVPTPLSIVQGVEKLLPGSVLTLHEGVRSLRPYWEFSLEDSEGRDKVEERGAVAGLRDALREAVRLEMVSDVPLGVFLSGGIDSSAVALAMSELQPGEVQSFSIGFENRSFDESPYARLVAAHLHLKHHEMVFTASDLLALVPRLPDLVDEPLGDSSILPTHLLSRFARERVKVALGGDGGDELLAGYSTLQAHRLADHYNHIPATVRHHLVEPIVQRLPVSMNNLSLDFRAKRFALWAGLPPVERHHRWLGSFAPEELPSLLGEGADGWEDPLGPARHHIARCREQDTLNQLLHLDMKLYLEGDILPKVDRASMASSLEARVPLLNNVVTDYLTRIPLSMKLRGFTRKWLLRKALQGSIPEAILRRPKKGFNLPVAHWLRSELRELVFDTLSTPPGDQDGWFQPRTVEQLLSDHLAGRRDNRKQIWTLLVFSLWANKYLKGAPSATVPADAVAQCPFDGEGAP